MDGNVKQALYSSIETFGTVDGPGIRLLSFYRARPMRCLYCHNPDTWAPQKGKSMTIDEILEIYEKTRDFIKMEELPLPEENL